MAMNSPHLIKIALIGAEGKLGKAISALYPVIPVSRSTSRTSLDCDLIIDVSSPTALQENLTAQKPMVIGTTGHADLTPILKAAEKLPIFYSPNFSLGAAILNKLASWVGQHFPADIDLLETHHTEKKDTPSGTALQIAKNLPKAKIHSIRSGKVIGEHTVIFNNAEEKLTLSHQVHTREAFARGAIAAAQFLFGKPPGLYGMDNLFDSKL
jgi:4-hydroxy-tetrahydrodipicolinate reductase